MSTPAAAKAAFEAYNRARRETDTIEADATDLIADLLLWLYNQGEDAAAIARMATEHFDEEAEPYRPRKEAPDTGTPAG